LSRVAPCSLELLLVILGGGGSGGKEEEMLRGRGDSEGLDWIAGVGVSSGRERMWKGLEEGEEG